MASSKHGGRPRVYLALGDSMSIDEYTGVAGGGAVAQFYKRLPDGWTLDDRTSDGCTIMEVPRTRRGDLITLTIGGNDALIRQDELVHRGTDALLNDHLNLLKTLRKSNPDSCLIIGNIYGPQTPLPRLLAGLLADLNDGLRRNVAEVRGCLADISGAFRGHEAEYLCLEIEPSLQGATVIAGLFTQEYEKWLKNNS